MSNEREDLGLRHARWEALLGAAIWIAASIYSVSYCSIYGYNRSAESLTFVLGFPDWVFWGVVVPWAICVVLSWCFSYLFMKDERLSADESDGEGPHV